MSSPSAISILRRAKPLVRSARRRGYTASASDLLADPDVAVIDIATCPPGRLALIEEAVAAGRHVLAQKPLCAEPAEVDRLLAAVRGSHALVAVNQNGRFAPAWRATTSLLRSRRLGRLRAITHVYDTSLRWLPDPRRQGTTQFLLFDYSNHWLDICRYWLEPDPVVVVQAMAYEVASGDSGLVQQSMWASLETAGGTNVVIRGAAAGVTHAGHRFLVQGDQGTIRGDVDSRDGEYLYVDDGHQPVQEPLDGSWFPDGFLGSMVELLRCIEEKQRPGTLSRRQPPDGRAGSCSLPIRSRRRRPDHGRSGPAVNKPLHRGHMRRRQRCPRR